MGEDEQKSAKYYVRVMERIDAKGKDFVQSEAARLEKLMDSKITDEKKKEMELRLNILSSYGAEITRKAKKKEPEPEPEEEAEAEADEE
eukprot:NODE_6241_length_463_cov_117.712560_g4730_i0.p1 GENE.NODE_6241_length_463_cov_117.712560_g4730_i0~~NODE_6241_length_463_cov_117.712560_g4730_i0.p1  ORF type:complete len:99 (+),score=63.10 NODE_6241_length_463_cov_117.712560_g4730_i0:32-298(+)